MILVNNCLVGSSEKQHKQITLEELHTYEDYITDDIIKDVEWSEVPTNRGTVVYMCDVIFRDSRQDSILLSFTGYDNRNDAVGALVEEINKRFDVMQHEIKKGQFS